MAQTFQLMLPSPVVVGGGVSQSLPEHARRLGLGRVLVVTDEYLLENGPVDGLVEALEAAGISASVYSGTQPDPTVANVGEAMERLHEHGGEGVIVIGGGRPIDAGKAVAIMACNPGGIADYAGLNKELEIPSLRELEVEGEAFEAALAPMADAAIASRSPEFNPRQASAEEIVALYREAY